MPLLASMASSLRLLFGVVEGEEKERDDIAAHLNMEYSCLAGRPRLFCPTRPRYLC